MTIRINDVETEVLNAGIDANGNMRIETRDIILIEPARLEGTE